MINALGELADEFHIIHPLIAEMRGIVVETKPLVMPHRLERAFGRCDVEGNFGRMHLEREIHIHFFKGIKDRQPTLGKVLVALVVIFLRGRRKRINRMPDRRTSEAVDHCRNDRIITQRLHIKKRPRRLGGRDHFFGRTLAHTFWVTITPNIRRQNRLVPQVDRITHGLTDKVI